MPPNLKTLLQKANLPVKVVEKPSQVNPRLRDDADRGAFLMDIRRDRGEVFVVRPGRAEVHVLNVDPARRQAVLFVHEEAGRVSFDRYDHRRRGYVTITEDVPESVLRKEAKKERVVRQGEWFFTKVEDGETLKSIERVVRTQGTLKKTALGAHLGPRRGRPHIADDRVLVVKRRKADIEKVKRQLANLPEGASGV